MLTGDERRTLENWVRRRSTAQGLALRARIVRACAQGGSNVAVAARLGVSRTTVRKWRTRFLRDRLDGLPDEPRPGVPRTITDAQVEEVVVRTLEEVPEGSTHWSKRELAARVGISPTSVHRIWRAFGLQPWRTETFKISPDPLLIDKIRDVAGLYLAPPANAAGVQRGRETADPGPGTHCPGAADDAWSARAAQLRLRAAWHDRPVRRVNIATGKVIGKLSAQHRAVDFRDFLDEIHRHTDPALEVHVICDNLSATSSNTCQLVSSACTCPAWRPCAAIASARGAISGATCFSAPQNVPAATSSPSAASACTIRCTGRPSTCFSYASRARNPAVNRPFGTGFAAGGAQAAAGPR